LRQRRTGQAGQVGTQRNENHGCDICACGALETRLIFDDHAIFAWNNGYLSFEASTIMAFYPEERLALFIDGANLYSAARALGFDIDYKRLLTVFQGKGRLIRAFYYTAFAEDQEYSPIRPLIDWLDYNGFAMVTKPLKEFTDSYGRRKVKGDMDIELAVDMMEMADRIDHAVLFSGDGDFRRLVQSVQRRGVRVSVVSTLRSQPPMIADELRRQADTFIELGELMAQIQRTERRESVPPVGPDRYYQESEA
jgi:uncharacterized LabA/DUF88 family protein